MKILAIDFETTGLDIKNDRIIEIGAVLWDADRKKVLDLQSNFVKVNYPISPDAQKVHQITSDDLEKHGISFMAAMAHLIVLISKSDALIAHNGIHFDYPLLCTEITRLAMISHVRDSKLFNNKLFIDSSVDIPFPDTVQTRKLEFLAACHGFLNPFSHRALFDCLTLCRILSQYDITKVTENAVLPDVTITPIGISPPWEDAGKSTGIIKEKGFRFHREDKFWKRTIKMRDYFSFQSSIPYELKILNQFDRSDIFKELVADNSSIGGSNMVLDPSFSNDSSSQLSRDEPFL